MKFIHPNKDGTFRDATEEEIMVATKIAEEKTKSVEVIAKNQMILDSIRRNCSHTVCYDVEGYPYNVRHCVACGDSFLL